MELHNLRPAKGAVKKTKRIARGQGSGHGGTSTRGHKGQKSRSGWKSKRAFEGGQMPLQMRIPKRGFKNINRVEYVALNLKRIQSIYDKHKIDTIDMKTLVEKGIVRKNDKIKILGGGELTCKVNVSAHACSEAAKSAIESKGGTVNVMTKSPGPA